MGDSWVRKPLGEIVSLQRGHDLPSQDRKDGTVPIMGSSGVTGYHNEVKTKGPGVVIGRSGNSMGEISFTHEDYWPLNTCLYVTDFKGNDERFIYYLLQTIDFDQFNSGSAQKSLNRNAVYPYVVLTTECKEEQIRIRKVLAALEDKIELNRQMNATLEAMAQALFKSWFVDFDPVIDNALAAGNPIPESLHARAEARKALGDKRAGEHDWTSDEDARRVSATDGANQPRKALGDKRKPLPTTIQSQFPNRFVFSEEMGWVPEGWSVGVFGDIASHVRDNVTSAEVGDFDFYVGLEHIGRKEIFLSDNASGESIGSNKSRFTENDVLFGKLRPYFHKVCIAPQEGICSTDILVFRAKDISFHSFMTMTAYREEFVEYANLRSTGTRMPRASAKDMLNFSLLIPNSSIAKQFELVTSSIWERGMASVQESKELAKLRDTLLPKLLSGQLRIPDAEKQLAEVI